MREVTNKPPPKSTWPKWMLIAAQEIGVRETPDGSNTPRILEYQRATRLDEQALGDDTAWCAAFVSWCLQEAGFKNPRFALAKNFLKYGEAVTVPEFGDLMIFDHGAYKHVAFFVLDIGSDYEVLGGNQHNSVRYGHEHKESLLGIRRPVRPDSSASP